MGAAGAAGAGAILLCGLTCGRLGAGDGVTEGGALGTKRLGVTLFGFACGSVRSLSAGIEGALLGLG